MDKHERHRRLLAELSSRQVIRIVQMAEMFNVTPETARRDLEELSEQGLLVRTYGGATLSSIAHEPPARMRATANAEQRRAIAKQALALTEDLTVLMIDGGSTTSFFSMELAVKLSHHLDRAMTVITNSVDVARILSQSRAVRVIVCPGDFDARESAMFGTRTIDFLVEFHADAVVFSSGGITQDGLTDVHSMAVGVKKQMLQQADRAILLVDDSKFRTKQLERICELTVLDDVVVNKPLPKEIQAALAKSDVAIHLA